MNIPQKHLRRLRRSQRQTNEAVQLLGKSHEHAGKALEITWEAVFDHLCQTPKENTPSLPDLNTIAAIIFKLAQSSQSLKSLEHKTRDYEEKLAEHRAMAARALATAQRFGMPPEMRDQLERDLNLI